MENWSSNRLLTIVSHRRTRTQRTKILDRIDRIPRISHGVLRERREKEVEVESLKKPA
jgi:hypothetical protein